MKVFNKVFFSVCFIGLILSCKQEIESLEAEVSNSQNIESEDIILGGENKSEYVCLKISVKDKSHGRTVLPESHDIYDEAVSFVLKGKTDNLDIPDEDKSFERKWIYEDGISAFKSMCAASDIIIRKGTWGFELLVYKEETLIFYNSLSQVQISNDDTTINFGILNDIGFGNGSILYRLYFPADSTPASVEYVISERNENSFNPETAFKKSELAEILFDEEKSQKYIEVNKADIDSGYKRIYFRIYNSLGIKIGNWQETVLVATNNISQKTAEIPFMDNYFHINYINSEKWNGVNCLINEKNFIENFNSSMDISLTKDMFSNPYYKIEGFYESADFSGDPVSKISANTKDADVSLYVKWVLNINEAEDFDAVENAILQAEESENNIYCATGLYHYESGRCKYFEMAESVTDLNIPFGTKMETVKYNSSVDGIYSLGDGSEFDYLKLPGVRYIGEPISLKVNVLEVENGFSYGYGSDLFSGMEVNLIKASSNYINSSSKFSTIKTEFSFEYTDEPTTIAKEVFAGSKIKAIFIPKTVTSISEKAFTKLSCLGKITFEEDSQLASIGDNAFMGLTKLTEIELPASVTRIGQGAFYECSELKKITINSFEVTIGSSIFYGCEELEINANAGVLSYGSMQDCNSYSINIIGEPVELGDKAFYSMTGLVKVTLPDSIKTLGKNVFEKCSSLREVALPENVTLLPDNSFTDCTELVKVTGMNHVTFIGTSAFQNCPLLEEITLGKDLSEIGTSAFYGCVGLKEIFIPSAVTSIGSGAFENCKELIRLSVEDFESYKLVSFGNSFSNPVYYTHSIFQGENEVTEYVIPEGTESVNTFITEQWTGLKKVYLPASITSIKYSAFENLDIEFVLETFGTFKLLNNISYKSYALDLSACEDLTKLADSCFKGKATLKGIKFPEALTEISTSCFDECSALEYCVAPGVTKVNESAFNNCWKLKKFESAGLIVVGANAFYSCIALKEIYAPELESLGNTAFNKLGTVKITMPLSKLGKGVFTGSIEIELVLTGTETEIGEKQFYVSSTADKDYRMISALTLPQSVTKIGDFAFHCWVGLKRLTLGNSVVSVGSNAFRDASLEELDLPETLRTVGQYAFSTSAGEKVGDYEPLKIKLYTSLMTTYNGAKFSSLIKGKYTIEFKDNVVETIPSFKDCTGLVNISIPETVTSIKSFDGCSNLTEISLPAGVTIIPSYAFQNCILLETVDIPEAVTQIKENAFYGCKKLSKVTFHGENLKMIYTKAFDDCSADLELDYPASITYAPYKVKYMLQNIENDEYTLYKTEDKTAEKVGYKVFPNTEYAPGSGRVTEESKIRNSTDSVIYFYYDRPIVTLTFDLKGGTTTTSLVDGNKLIGKAGTPLNFDIPTIEVESGEKKLVFLGWNEYKDNSWETLPKVFPAEDASYTVVWGDREKPGAPGNFTVSVSTVDAQKVVTCSWNLPEDDDILAFKVVMVRPNGVTLTYSVDNPKATSTTISGVNVNSTSGDFTFYCYAVDISRNNGVYSQKIVKRL